MTIKFILGRVVSEWRLTLTNVRVRLDRTLSRHVQEEEDVLQEKTYAKVGALSDHEIGLVPGAWELENENEVHDRPHVCLCNQGNGQKENDGRFEEQLHSFVPTNLVLSINCLFQNIQQLVNLELFEDRHRLIVDMRTI